MVPVMRVTGVLVLVGGLGGCGWSAPADPALTTLGQAVTLAGQGEAALAAGDAATARARFDAARALRPEDALLGAWAARAAAAQGDLDGALALLDTTLAQAPAFGEARLQRACYRARAGRLDDAAADLHVALDAGVLTPRQALRDPDLAAVANAPAFAFLPDAPFSAVLTAPDALAFWGTEVQIRVDVVGAGPEPVTIGSAGAGGPVTLVRVVEDDAVGADGDTIRTVAWTYRVDGAGSVAVGPVQVGQGRWSATTAATSFETAAPPDRPPAPTVALDRRTPSSVLGDRVPPAVWRAADVVWVAAPPGGRVQVEPGVVLPPVWPLRHGGEPVADLLPLPGTVTSVRIRVGDDVVFDGSPD